MRGAAVTMSEDIPPEGADVILASDYLDLASLAGMLPPRLSRIPRAVYFHENQLTYPLPAEDERDYQFGFTNITSCLSAGLVIFNSRYHRDSFLDAVDALLRKMPDCVPGGVG